MTTRSHMCEPTTHRRRLPFDFAQGAAWHGWYRSDVRQQLSLYLPQHSAAVIDAVRRVLDPVQSALIPAHVTLCREDELAVFSATALQSRLANLKTGSITLSFGRPEVFSGHGILLHCIAGEDSFRQLRERVLGSTRIRLQRPHLTLAHPRNPKSAENSLDAAARLPEVIAIRFDAIQWIEQVDDRPWRLLRQVAMG